MQHELLFATISTVGITLAGFSGIAITMVSEGRPLTVRQRERFEVLMVTSLGAALLALLPMCLYALELGESIWRTSSGIFALLAAPALAIWVFKMRESRKTRRDKFNGRYLALLALLELMNLGAQVAAALGISPGPGVYALGLLLLLGHGALQFRRMLFQPGHYGP